MEGYGFLLAWALSLLLSIFPYGFKLFAAAGLWLKALFLFPTFLLRLSLSLYLSLIVSSLKKSTRRPPNCLTIFIMTNESSIRPIGPRIASGRRSNGDSVYTIIIKINFTRELVNKNLSPSWDKRRGICLRRVPIYVKDLKRLGSLECL